MHALNTVIFEWTPPDLNAPVDVTIAFDYVHRYDGLTGAEYEEPDPYVEAVYVGNIDIMPVMDTIYVDMALEAYLKHIERERNEQY